MRYKKFIIRRYRGIRDDIVLDVANSSLIPIIGVNECGKTTILKAVFAFDHTNDTFNDSARHLEDVHNLYDVTDSVTPSVVAAEIDLSWNDLRGVLDEIEQQDKTGAVKATVNLYRRRRSKYESSLLIERDLGTKKYQIGTEGFSDPGLNHEIAHRIILMMPYILYFDDFRDAVEEIIEIKPDAANRSAGWLAIIEELFNRVDKSYSVFNLPQMEERKRKSVLARVGKYLNATLTRQWQSFRLDDSNALRIDLGYSDAPKGEGGTRSYLKLDIVETDLSGREHFFFIRDRSKGFYWFFNFVMKLEFNPKVLDEIERNAIYLLDEPGSYLHASAQSKLCAKLKQISAHNTVVYCTHSHYLLDPKVIPINSIRIADKDDGAIRLLRMHEYKGAIVEKHSPFQPILDALQVQPFGLDFAGEHVLLTEGIIDYYAFELLKGTRSVRAVPSVGADAMKTLISLMIGWRCDYKALWDNDDAGRDAKRKADGHFGEAESRKRFFLLPKPPRRKTRLLQDLFSGSDMAGLRAALGLPRNAAFDKTILTLYYHTERAAVVSALSDETRKNFAEVFELLGI